MKQDRETFKKKHRLRKSAAFGYVYASAKRLAGKFFVFYYLSNNSKTKSIVSQLGVTVSTKVSKRAVKRNYIKRVLREWFRKKQSDFKVVVKVVVVARQAASDIKGRDLITDLDNLARRAKLV